MTRDEEAIEAVERKRRRRQARGGSGMLPADPSDARTGRSLVRYAFVGAPVALGAMPVVRVDAVGRVVGEFDL